MTEWWHHALGYIGIGVTTYFWLWYLTYEAEKAKGLRKKVSWWEKKLW